MKKTIFMDKYPVYTLELLKSEVKQINTDEIVEYFVNKIEDHPIAVNISVFDHFSHTKKLGGEIESSIINAKNVVFCFGAAIPSTKILAARPRSIGIAEFEDKFVVEFIEAPNEKLHDVMESWTKALKI